MTTEELLSREFAASHTVDAARVLEQMHAEERVSFLNEVSSELGSQLVQLMAPSIVGADLERIDELKAAAVLALLPPNAASVLLRRMAERRRSAI